MSRHVRRVERAETSVSSRAVWQARHSRNALGLTRQTCRNVTWRDEPSGIWAQIGSHWKWLDFWDIVLCSLFFAFFVFLLALCSKSSPLSLFAGIWGINWEILLSFDTEFCLFTRFGELFSLGSPISLAISEVMRAKVPKIASTVALN